MQIFNRSLISGATCQVSLLLDIFRATLNASIKYILWFKQELIQRGLMACVMLEVKLNGHVDPCWHFSLLYLCSFVGTYTQLKVVKCKKQKKDRISTCNNYIHFSFHFICVNCHYSRQLHRKNLCLKKMCSFTTRGSLARMPGCAGYVLS